RQDHRRGEDRYRQPDENTLLHGTPRLFCRIRGDRGRGNARVVVPRQRPVGPRDCGHTAVAASTHLFARKVDVTLTDMIITLQRTRKEREKAHGPDRGRGREPEASYGSTDGPVSRPASQAMCRVTCPFPSSSLPPGRVGPSSVSGPSSKARSTASRVRFSLLGMRCVYV